MNYFLKVLQNFANFNGRARRKEYWYFALFNMIFLIIAMVLDNVLGTTFEVEGMKLPYGYIYLLFAIAFFIPYLAVSVRRLHDVGKSGWMLLLSFIPIIGAIWLLVLFFTDSSEDNEYGPNPKMIVE